MAPKPGPNYGGTTNSAQPNPVNIGGPDPTMYGISQNQGALEIPLGPGGLFGLTPGGQGDSEGSLRFQQQRYRQGGTSNVTLTQLIQEFYQLPRDQQIAVEQQLWDGGFYTDMAGNPMKSAPQIGSYAAETTKALQNAALEAAGTGRALNTVIGDAVQGGKGAGQHNVYKPGVIGHGYRNVIDLTNPADVNYTADQMAQKLLGRGATDQEKQDILSTVQSQEFASGMAHYQANEQMSHDTFEARVSDRDAQMYYYTGQVPGGAGGAGGVSGGGPAAQQQVMAFLQGKGLSAPQAAGIVGNLQQESNLDPNAPGGGIAQWIGGRWQNLQNFAAQQGKSPNDIAVQLDFLWHELNGSESGSLQALKQTNDAASAAQAFSNNFERPGTPMMSNRVNYANQALAGSAAANGTANASGAPQTIQGMQSGTGLGASGVQSFISTAESQIGVPYQWGGETAGSAFDCSGLVQWAMKQHGLDPGRTTYQQYANPQGAKVDSLNNAQAGDLIFFDPTGGQSPDHVGIYLGGGQMLDADHTGSSVGVRKSVQGYGTIVGIKRFPVGSGMSGTNVIGGNDTYIPGANTVMTKAAGLDAAAYAQESQGANQLPFEAHTTLNNVGIINNMIRSAR